MVKITETKDVEQILDQSSIGNICGEPFMICRDIITSEYRLVSMATGFLLTESYSSLQDLLHSEGDFELASHAELVWKE